MKTLKFVSMGLVAFAICGLMAFAQQGQTKDEEGGSHGTQCDDARVRQGLLGLPAGVRSLCDPLCAHAERRQEGTPDHPGNLSRLCDCLFRRRTDRGTWRAVRWTHL